MAAPQWETVRIDGPDSAGIATLTLNRPSRFNALNPSLFQEIPAAVRVLDLDPATRVIIVNAAGRHFCSGIDLTHFSAIIGMAQYSHCVLKGLKLCLRVSKLDAFQESTIS
jgi:enoyl-CoA hydratase/carnithine racemase